MTSERKLINRVIAAVMLAFSCAALLTCCDIKAPGPEAASGARQDWKIAVGEKLPSFSLKSVDGQTVTLDQYAGKPLVISMFATWCGPCRDELPQLEQRVWQAMRDKGVQVIAVSRGEEAAAVEAFLKSIPLTFPVLLDPEEEYSSKLAGDGIPRLIVMDKDHVVRHLELGYFAPRFLKVVKVIEGVAEGKEDPS